LPPWLISDGHLEVRVIFAGVDWAEAHHDVCVMGEDGRVLEQCRISHDVVGIGELHALVATHAQEQEPVAVGVEVDRGLVVAALLAAGYQVYAVNPLASARYRDRHSTSGAKSDRGDAKVLADLVRTDRHNHRQVAGDSEVAEAVKVLARAHQSAVWSRQRQVNALRSALREYYPAALAAFGTGLADRDAVAVLALALTSEAGRALSRSKIASALRRAGRQRNIEQRATEITAALRADCLQARPLSQALTGQRPAQRSGSSALIPPRSRSLRKRWRSILTSTRTPRSSVPCQDWGRSSAPGCWASSVTTGPVLPAPSLARTTPARHPSPGHPAAAASCCPATSATGAWPTLWTGGHSVPSPHHRELAPTTTSSAPAAKPIARPCGSSPTAGLASCTSASSVASSTTKLPPGSIWKPPLLLDTFQPWGV
jgi:transposase